MTPRAWPFAETFHAPQGEGVYAGTQMTFLRLVGCSVGKRICTHCDTDFDAVLPDMGGGLLTVEEVLALVGDDRHVCLTGGEPLDRDLRPLLEALGEAGKEAHLETSGTTWPRWLDRPAWESPAAWTPPNGRHLIDLDLRRMFMAKLWVTVSPKPGFLPEMVERVADEVKVIMALDKDMNFLGGLGDGPGWPTVEDAIRWADTGKVVYLQPRNAVKEVDGQMLDRVLAVVARHPQLRISPQIHKFLKVR